jgi:hypothetical protein
MQPEGLASDDAEATPKHQVAADLPSAKAATKPKRKNHIIFVD